MPRTYVRKAPRTPKPPPEFDTEPYRELVEAFLAAIEAARDAELAQIFVPEFDHGE